MTPEQRMQIVASAYTSHTGEAWPGCKRQEFWLNLVDEVNRRPHMNGGSEQEEAVRKAYLEIVLGKVVSPPVEKQGTKAERLAAAENNAKAEPIDEPKGEKPAKRK